MHYLTEPLQLPSRQVKGAHIKEGEQELRELSHSPGSCLGSAIAEEKICQTLKMCLFR